MKDDVLARALREMRDGYDGSSPHEDETLARIFETLDAQKATPEARVLPWRAAATKRTLLRTTVALAATLALTTAWAAGTGRLAQLFSDAPTEPTARPAAPPAMVTTAQSQQATSSATSTTDGPAQTAEAQVDEPAAGPSSEVAPAAPSQPPTAPTSAHAAPVASSHVAQSPRTTLPTERAVVEGVAPSTTETPEQPDAPNPAQTEGVTTAPAASAEPIKPAVTSSDEGYERAHKLHFSGSYAAALEAWDTYLRESPSGRFVPEARFNRAIALWKLGRRDEAARALEPFARGAYGEYRREEAQRLLDAAGR